MGTHDRETLIGQLAAMLGSAAVHETTIIGTTAEGERAADEGRDNFEFANGRGYTIPMTISTLFAAVRE